MIEQRPAKKEAKISVLKGLGRKFLHQLGRLIDMEVINRQLSSDLDKPPATGNPFLDGINGPKQNRRI